MQSKAFRLTAMMILVAMMSVLVAACTPTGDSTEEPESAQNLLPNIEGYTANDVDNIVNALTTLAAGASATTGNVPLAAGLARVEGIAQCLQDTGSIAANTYIESSPANFVPEVGAALVINQTRVADNLVSCITGAAGGDGVSAQSVVIEPCFDTGSLTFNGDQVSYVYVGVGENLCGFMAQHFNDLSN
jgi:hypothetical protein